MAVPFGQVVGSEAAGKHEGHAPFGEPVGDLEAIILADQYIEDCELQRLFGRDATCVFGIDSRNDLGHPELGSFSLAEMQALELPLGMGIERDILFAGVYPLSVYAQAARTARRIVIDERSLRAAAAALQREGQRE